jgi:cytoskeletal protein RodZ
MTVGQELKKRRQALHISLREVEVQTKIRGKFLTSLEAGDYEALANDIYSRGFVQQYATFLGLEGTTMAARYSSERGGLATAATSAPKLDRPKRIVITARLVTVAIIAAIVLSVLTYLLVQLSALAAPPNVTITSPEDNQTVIGSVTTVSGHVTPGSDVTIDDVAVISDGDGNFSSPVTLQNGLNTIHVTAKSKLGKTSTAGRTVLAKVVSATGSAVTVPTTTIPGIAVAVKAKRTLALVVSVDGKQTKELLLGGTSQLFQGTSDVNLSTSDAGATSLTITNSVMAGKVISSLGSDGETRSNQDFTPTTVIP